MDTERNNDMPELQEPYIYKDLNEVPEKWKAYKGARLNLEQINKIIEYAYEKQIVNGDTYIPDYGAARAKFEESNEIQSNFWVSKKEDKVNLIETAKIKGEK